ncbi:MAG: tRNA (adenosine(37)-N6)-threonylcarbamoyltransferase complex dimerization subunit type 1 TsaB [Firmicutes bacterium]|nr:tRNA (adenosine(37)-N6)-threonylcarbamoyltransferase complex dimerization subunit type 1 TsaB [Bacillota bacterium]
MLILGIDTAFSMSSIALVNNGKILSELQAYRKMAQLVWLTPTLQDFLKRNEAKWEDIKGVAVTSGPGSYTGSRLAVVTARSIAQVLDVPVAPINTLECMIKGVPFIEGLLCPLIDARKGEIFTALYYNNERVSEYMVLKPEELLTILNEKNEKVYLFGDGIETYENVIAQGLKTKFQILPPFYYYSRASVAAQMGEKMIASGRGKPYYEVNIFYSRPVQITIKR